MSSYQNEVISLINDLGHMEGEDSLKRVAGILSYKLIKNPVTPESEWKLLTHPYLDQNSQALMALKYDENLTKESNVPQLRKRYEEVLSERTKFGTYTVSLYAFIGVERIVIFRAYGGNRDERLDLSVDSIQRVSLYADSFMSLHKDRIKIEEDEFGFGSEIIGLDEIFKRELTNQFNLIVKLYRKRIAETIATEEEFGNIIIKLLPKHLQKELVALPLEEKLLDPYYKSAIGNIVDTIVLRIMLRRFLESYHGLDQFTKKDDLRDIGFGQGEGKMEDVLQYLAEVKYETNLDETKLKKAIKDNGSEQLSLFEEVTSGVYLIREEQLKEIYNRLRNQFELAYGGDLFDSDVAQAANRIEDILNDIDPTLLLNLWADTSSQRFNFRYEDLPPEQIQEHYEDSMSHSIQIKIQEGGRVKVEYTDNIQEQKHKGAFYTNTQLVNYTVENTVGKKLEEFRKKLSQAVKENNKENIEKLLLDIVNIKVIDLTCGGGSFLRGAFRFLSSKRNDIVRTIEMVEDDILREDLLMKFPCFENSSNGEYIWEKHILLQMIYGIDIDHKALIISTQTLTLSALKNWQAGENFPQLIGLTLMHQNALITPVRVSEREEIFSSYKEEIKELIDIRRQIMDSRDAKKSKELHEVLFKKRLILQERVGVKLDKILGEYREAMIPQSIEINFPEIFFDDEGNLKENPGFTVCVGNPPWEEWERSEDEFFEIYIPGFRNMKKQEKGREIKKFLDNHLYLKKRWGWLEGYYRVGNDYFLQNQFFNFQRVKIDNSFTRGHVNLYKVSTERAYQILQETGECGFLVPSSLYTDQGSTGIRQMIFDNTTLREVSSFENKKGIFPHVHRSYKFAILLFNKSGKTTTFKGFFYKHYLDSLYDRNSFLSIPVELIKKLSPDTLSILEFKNQMEIDILKKLSSFPLLKEKIVGKWNIEFNREFNRSDDSHLFNLSKKGNPLYEGKMIWQFTDQYSEPEYYVDQEGYDSLVSKEKKRIEKVAREYTGLNTKEANRKLFNKEDIPSELVDIPAQYYRIGYRSVGRSTDRRTLIATLIPKNSYCSNSIFLSKPFQTKFENGKLVRLLNYTYKEALLIVGLLNSFVVDFIVRRKTSANVNIYIVNQLPIPRLIEGDRYFDNIVSLAGKLICTHSKFDEIKQTIGIREGINDNIQRQKLQNQIDAYVAKIYGVTRDELIYILSTFKSIVYKDEFEEIAQEIIEQFDKLNEEGEIECQI